jgi:putative ABC transport system permease protein
MAADEQSAAWLPRSRSWNMSAFLQDLRQTLRSAPRAPAATAVLLLSLALGTGSNAAVYGAMRSLLLSAPPGVGDSSRIVALYTSEFSGATYGPSSYADFLSVKGTRAFESVAASDDHAVENVRTGPLSATSRIAAVTEEFFKTLHMTASAGRLLSSDDFTANTPGAVVSDALASQLGGPSALLGAAIEIADRTYSVVGITPHRFRGLHVGRECDVWIPMTSPRPARGDRRLAMFARLAPGVTIAAADEAMRDLSDDLAVRFPQTNRGTKDQADAPRRLTAVRYSPLDPSAIDQVRLVAIVIGGAAALLLASACLNVGSLLLSAALARRSELAVKMALGATRGRLVRQFLTETICLCLAGGALGLLFAWWTAGAIPALFMAEQAEQLDLRIRVSTMLLTVGVGVLAGVVFGVGPALQGTAAPPATVLRSESASISIGRDRSRLRAWLVAGQVGLSTTLLIGTGLAVSSLNGALDAGLGNVTRHVAIMSVELPGRFHDSVRGIAFRNALLDELSRTPGVEAAGWASRLPVNHGGKQLFHLEGTSTEVTDAVELDTNVVSPEYFRALMLQLLEGRLFAPTDSFLASPVVIVDELLASRYFAGSAIGHYLRDARGTTLEIIGIVRTGRYRTLQESAQPTVYFPYSQDYLYVGHAIVRTTGDPLQMLPALESAVNRAGTGGTLQTSSTLDAHLANVLALDRLITTLIGVCGLIALAMSTIGIYGVMTDTVRRRTREIGVRVALGAERLTIARMVFASSMRLAILGLVGGLATALATTLGARTYFYGVPMLNLTILAVAAGALLLVVALAAIVPLRQALGVNPIIALRAE